MFTKVLRINNYYCISELLDSQICLQDILERFSIDSIKTKTKVITLASHKGHRQYSKPIKTRSNYM